MAPCHQLVCAEPLTMSLWSILVPMMRSRTSLPSLMDRLWSFVDCA